MFDSWRGVVGDIKPTHRPGSLEDFIRLLPEGIGVISLTVGISSGTEQEFRDVLDDYKQKAAQLAQLGADMVYIGGAPPMMVHGFHGEAKIVHDLEGENSCAGQHFGAVADRRDACAWDHQFRRRHLLRR